jgi:hypothetical protein
LSNSDRRYSILKQLGGFIETLLVEILKGLLSTTVGQGLLKKLFDWVIPKLSDVTLKPLLDAAAVEIGYRFDVKDGHVLVKKLQAARENGNASDYDRTVDDILG